MRHYTYLVRESFDHRSPKVPEAISMVVLTLVLPDFLQTYPTSSSSGHGIDITNMASLITVLTLFAYTHATFLPGIQNYQYEWGPICETAITPVADRRLANGRMLSSYPDMQSFCTASHWGGDFGSNLGGTCVVLPGRNYDTGLILGEPFGDPSLYHLPRFREACRDHCDCEMPLGWDVEWAKAAEKMSRQKGVADRNKEADGTGEPGGVDDLQFCGKPPPGGFPGSICLLSRGGKGGTGRWENVQRRRGCDLREGRCGDIIPWVSRYKSQKQVGLVGMISG
ncbi:MAG: hypothetical protein M1814_006428 [Vezdaea aestivalis]|nr:MAG: hypothetical protein M1814_006428 [Vezdaea aestivalis]